jgi:hypothetical protein
LKYQMITLLPHKYGVILQCKQLLIHRLPQPDQQQLDLELGVQIHLKLELMITEQLWE